jgi:hypothetical protein
MNAKNAHQESIAIKKVCQSPQATVKLAITVLKGPLPQSQTLYVPWVISVQQQFKLDLERLNNAHRDCLLRILGLRNVRHARLENIVLQMASIWTVQKGIIALVKTSSYNALSARTVTN